MKAKDLQQGDLCYGHLVVAVEVKKRAEILICDCYTGELRIIHLELEQQV